MKKIVLLILGIITINTFLTAQNSNQFYYSFDKKIFLNPVTDKYIAEFILEEDSIYLKNNQINFKRLDDNLYELNGNFNILNNLKTDKFSLTPLYKTTNGQDVIIKNQIVLKWKHNISSSEKNDVINNFNLFEFSTNRLFSIYNVNYSLPISKSIFESGIVEYCYPVFKVEIQSFNNNDRFSISSNKYSNLNNNFSTDFIPNDEYFVNQWYLHNTGQVCNDGNFGTPDADIDAPEAWEITKGNPNISIAVLDHGLSENSIELPLSRQLRLPGSNFTWNVLNIITPYDNPDNPLPWLHVWGNYHGEAIAGIIAAEDNDLGIIGVAPLCKIMPIKINYSSLEYLAEGIIFAVDNGANVINICNGIYTQPDFINPAIEDALTDATNNNISVVIANGNDANHSPYPLPSHPNPNTANNDGTVAYPARSNVEHIISVGASDRNDYQANYSPTSEKVDICAPSSTDLIRYNMNGQQTDLIPNERNNVWSLDLPGYYGVNDNPDDGIAELPNISNIIPDIHLDITGRFGGTSAAAPQVAGVIALMLSVNPCLSVPQITDILYKTADKVGGYNYNWNSSRPGHSKELGYGRLNAYNAVSVAQQMHSSDLDLYIKDSPSDFGVEPNTTTQYMWTSEDIWVRNNNDDGLEHQNPEYKSNGQPNYLKVRIINKSCIASTGNETLTINWAKANTALFYPDNWDGSLQNSNNFDLGGLVTPTPVTIPILQSGEETIMTIEWVVPNPQNYIIGEGSSNIWHFCILATINGGNDPMSFPFTSNPNIMVRNNNNQAWKNVTVVDLVNDTGIVNPGAMVAVSNPVDQPIKYRLELVTDLNEKGKAIYDEAEVTIKMDDVLYNAWQRGGKMASNIETKNEDLKISLVKDNNVILDNILFNPREYALLNLNFNFLTKEHTDKTQYKYHLIQKDALTGEVVGGETFVIQKNQRVNFVANAGDNKEIDLNEPIVISAQDINEPAIYNWYDSEGNLIYQGKELQIANAVAEKYKLEVIATTDGFKDYNEVEVTIKPSRIVSVTPNPANSDVTIDYKLNGVNSAYLMVLDFYNNSTVSNNYILDLNNSQTNINISDYPSGFYTIALVCDGQIVDAKTLIKL